MTQNTKSFITNINLNDTLFSGQTFMWRRDGDTFYACVGGQPVLAQANGRELNITSQGGEWENYFDLNRDYGRVMESLKSDEYIQKAYLSFGGLRVLNQPVWETLISFIISANNNIKRITGIIDRLCMRLGEEKNFMGRKLYSFPEPQGILGIGEQGLVNLGLGYRAAYIYDTAKRIAEGYDLDNLKNIGYDNALKELVSFKGVGEKVADCVLLFSLGYGEAFPVDVWMLKVMKELYSIQGSPAKVKREGRARFNENAGLAQQLLFHGARMNLF